MDYQILHIPFLSLFTQGRKVRILLSNESTKKILNTFLTSDEVGLIPRPIDINSIFENAYYSQKNAQQFAIPVSRSFEANAKGSFGPQFAQASSSSSQRRPFTNQVLIFVLFRSIYLTVRVIVVDGLGRPAPSRQL